MKEKTEECRLVPFGNSILLEPNDLYYKAMKKVDPFEVKDKDKPDLFKGLALESEDAKKELVMKVVAVSVASQKNDDFPVVGDMLLFKNGCVFEEISFEGKVYVLVDYHRLACKVKE